MYKRAINLLPLSVDLRIGYIKLLYVYEKDDELVNELKGALSITKTVVALREKSNELKALFADFERFHTNTCYSQYDAKELTLNSWVETLFLSLRANPEDTNLVLRIIEIWHELGRIDKAVELLEDYSVNYFKKCDLDNSVRVRLEDIYGRFTKRGDRDNNLFMERLAGLKKVLQNKHPEQISPVTERDQNS